MAAALSILLLTTVLALAWSHAKLLWNDEFLSFYSDSVATLRGVLRVQLHTPISLDPPTYHLLSHLSMDVLGRTATALRLPALMGFLLLQWSLFVLVRRLAGVRSALVAMAVPMATASFRYAVEGRPYGLLLGLYAASLACWFSATQQVDEGSEVPPSSLGWQQRWTLLLGLFLSVALAITSHYFGVLILLPVSVGELARTLQRRRFDWPLIATLSAGLASVALIVPFKEALAPYQRHYYTSSVNLRNVSQGYREIFVRYNAWPMPLQHAVAVLLVVAVLALLWAMLRRFRNRPADEPAYLWVALLALLALPFFGYLFGRFVTHTMEVRYVMAALIFFAVALALVLAPLLRTRAVFAAVLTLLLGIGTAAAVVQVRDEAHASHLLLAQMQDVPVAALQDGGPIYVQTLSDFFLRSYYTADPALRARYVFLYDADREVRWLHHDTNAVTADYLRQFTALRTASYADLAAQHTAMVLVAAPGGWNWLRPELAADPHLYVTPLGTMGGLQLQRVDWPAGR